MDTNELLKIFGGSDPQMMTLYKGILGGPSDEEKKSAVNMGLLHAGLGLLGRKNIGDAGILGVQAGQGYLDKNVAERKNNLAAAMQMMQLKKQMDSSEALRKFTSGQSDSPISAQSALTEGASQGDIGPTVTNAARIAQQPASNKIPNFGALIASNVPPETVKALMEDWKLRNPEATVHNGYAVPPMRGLTAPKLMPGIFTSSNGQTSAVNPDASGNAVVSAPTGALSTYSQYQDAGERAKARYDLVTTPPLSPNLPPTRGSRLDALGIGNYPLTPAQPTPQQASPQSGQPPDSNFLMTPQFAALPPQAQEMLRNQINSGGQVRVGVSPDGNAVDRREEAKQIPSNAAGMSPLATNTVKSSEVAGTEFIKEIRDNYSKLRDVPVAIRNAEESIKLIPDAKVFMGPGGEPLLQAAKFLNNRLGTEIKTEGVKGAEELRSRIFMQIMDNLKKMDSQPSQQQQLIMQDALGKLGTDPNSLPLILKAYTDVLRGKVDLHNEIVNSAESRGINFPHEVRIKLPENLSIPNPPAATPSSAPKVRRFNPVTGRIE